jgi:hypothetical protein
LQKHTLAIHLVRKEFVSMITTSSTKNWLSSGLDRLFTAEENCMRISYDLWGYATATSRTHLYRQIKPIELWSNRRTREQTSRHLYTARVYRPGKCDTLGERSAPTLLQAMVGLYLTTSPLAAVENAQSDLVMTPTEADTKCPTFLIKLFQLFLIILCNPFININKYL